MQTIDPHEIERQVVLSLVLEPIAEKDGCTTRTKDLNESTKLQYFLAAGVNVGRYFYDLADRTKKAHGQPPVFYDLALEALEAGTTTIKSKKFINFGLLDLLFPVVLSSLLTDGDGKDVCANVVSVLKNSSAEDVRYRDLFRMKGFSTSKRAEKRSFSAPGGNNLYENHQKWLQLSKDADYTGGVLWAQEFLDGLPMLVAMYEEAKKHIDDGILVALEKSFPIGMKHINNLSAGFVADFSAAIAYLLLRDAGDEHIIA